MFLYEFFFNFLLRRIIEGFLEPNQFLPRIESVEKIFNTLIIIITAMELTTLKDLFVHHLQDLYSAESQLLKALPKMAKKANNEELQRAFEKHAEETERQRERLDEVFEMLGTTKGRVKCVAMEGLIEEGSELMKEEADPEVLDAGLIAASQKIEHYEIAAYGTARTYASQLGEKKVEKLLQETLEEEKRTDALLTELAVSSINISAAEGQEAEE